MFINLFGNDLLDPKSISPNLTKKANRGPEHCPSLGQIAKCKQQTRLSAFFSLKENNNRKKCKQTNWAAAERNESCLIKSKN